MMRVTRPWWRRLFGKNDGLSDQERAARAAASTYEDEPEVESDAPGLAEVAAAALLAEESDLDLEAASGYHQVDEEGDFIEDEGDEEDADDSDTAVEVSDESDDGD